MPHVNQITDPALRSILQRMNIPSVKLRIYLQARMLTNTGNTQGGFPQLSATYSLTTWDIGEMVQPGGVSFSQSKPIVQGEGELSDFLASKCTLRLVNPSQWPFLAASQTGAILDLDSIEDAELKIEASFQGQANAIPLFMGRIEGPPTEKLGETTLTAYDCSFRQIVEPLVFENFEEVNTGRLPVVGGQDAVVVNNRLRVNPYTVTSTVDSFEAHNGAITFDSDGRPISTIENSDPDKIDLRRIQILNGAKPGIYRLEFEDSVNYKLTFPDNSEQFGSINANFLGSGVQIIAQDWTAQDGEGVKITWKTCANMVGNGGTMILNLIEKAYTKGYGEIPGTNPGAALVAVNWASFREFERIVKGFKLWVSLTNEDNASWGLQDGSRPLSWIQAAQQIADHYGASILTNESGQLYIQHAALYNENIETLDTKFFISDGFSIGPPQGGRKWSRFQIKYGYNLRSKSYSITDELDLTTGTAVQTPPTKSLELPFYKRGWSRNAVAWLLDLLKRRFYDNPRTFSVTVRPGQGLVTMPGDRFRLELNTQPKGVFLAEVFNVPGKTPGDDGQLRLFGLQDQEGSEFVLCLSDVGDLVN